MRDCRKPLNLAVPGGVCTCFATLKHTAGGALRVSADFCSVPVLSSGIAFIRRLWSRDCLVPPQVCSTMIEA